MNKLVPEISPLWALKKLQLRSWTKDCCRFGLLAHFCTSSGTVARIDAQTGAPGIVHYSMI